MARLFSDGAEAGDTLFFDVPSLGTGNVSSTNAQARIGGRAYLIGNDQSRKNISAVSEFFLRAAIYLTGNTAMQIAWGSSGTTLGSLRHNTTSRCLDIYTGAGTLRASGTKVLAIQTWYVVELRVKIDDASGVISFKIDGTAQESFSGDTKPGSETTVNEIYFISGAVGVYFDDLALNNTSGGSDNSWCGDSHYYGLTPSGNGDSSQWVGSDGNSTNNFQLVDEIPPNSDTDYVQTATSSDKDLYAFSDLPSLPAGSTIQRVVVETRARELTADGDSINLGVKSSTTESFSSNIVVGVSYSRQAVEFTTNPHTTAAWTESEVNSMQAGIKLP